MAKSIGLYSLLVGFGIAKYPKPEAEGHSA